MLLASLAVLSGAAFAFLDTRRTHALSRESHGVNILLTDLRRLREVALPLVGRDPVGCVYSQSCAETSNLRILVPQKKSAH